MTPHRLTIVGQDGTVLNDQAPDAPMARRAEDRHQVGTVTLSGGAAVPLRTVRFAELIGLPAPRADVLYVVSRSTAEAAARDDVVYPDEPVRDDAGRVIGCRALALAR